jgi:hypothetical protein
LYILSLKVILTTIRSATDHVFTDSDVIIRETEPSSLIAFALDCQDYRAKLESDRERDAQYTTEKPADSHMDFEVEDQSQIERALHRETGSHLKYHFQEGSASMLCKIFYAEQFEAVRKTCGVADRIVESLTRCLKWDSKGGKSKSVFLKTLDDRFVLKSLQASETQAYLKFAPAYFQIMSEVFFRELPSVIAKMLGFYQVIIKNPVTGTDIKWDLLLMENLFYDRIPSRVSLTLSPNIRQLTSSSRLLISKDRCGIVKLSPPANRTRFCWMKTWSTSFSRLHCLLGSTRRSFSAHQSGTTRYSSPVKTSWTTHLWSPSTMSAKSLSWASSTAFAPTPGTRRSSTGSKIEVSLEADATCPPSRVPRNTRAASERRWPDMSSRRRIAGISFRPCKPRRNDLFL